MPGSRSMSANMATHIVQSTTTLAVCWRVERTDSTVLGFTSHDRDIIYDGVTYKASTGIAPSTVKTSIGTGIDNLDVMGTLRSGDITKEDLLNGVYDYAKVKIFLINYNNTADGIIVLSNGKMGEVKLTKNQFTVEIRSLIQILSQNYGRVESPTCDAEFGDSRCGVNLAGSAGGINITHSGTVTSVTDNRLFIASTLSSGIPDNWFKDGKITWLTGSNSNAVMDVKGYTQSTRQIELQFETGANIQVGDTFSIIAGCDKLDSTCRITWNNLVNFRGFPHVPGVDSVFKIIPE